MARYINQTLAIWLKRKYKRFHHRLGRARLFLEKIARLYGFPADQVDVKFDGFSGAGANTPLPAPRTFAHLKFEEREVVQASCEEERGNAWWRARCFSCAT
ncbi:hypothetical protein [Bradyrhizobium vignae]|uniref:hypothetical protein n=1 Tax=Bradyrhizobium TaxID=374 RepID=UPI00322188BE